MGIDPQSIEHIKAEIVAGRLRLPGKLTALAHWTFENPAEVALATALSLARQCDVPPSAVQRLASALGFTGFRRMKAAYRVHAARQAARGRSFQQRMLALDPQAESVE
ncbi:hypothetical protein [Shinella sp. BYT-45]|uniref:hypothetical protein n=1 Tax=Shinella sp. BYT-45 TaxID=3377377 RepID=UPI003980F2AF